jgi:GNAT superfamily N-acetyltransferase
MSGNPRLEVNGASVVFRAASADEIIGLRHMVLRAGKPRETAIFPEDADPQTRHFGAFVESDAISCVTYLSSSRDGAPAWQMRGMATNPSFARRGVGSGLLVCAEVLLQREQPATVALWANAREGAMPFYAKQGWRTVGDRFEVPNVGPHYVIEKALAPASAT